MRVDPCVQVLFACGAVPCTVLQVVSTKAAPATLSIPETQDAVKYAKVASVAYDDDQAMVRDWATAVLVLHLCSCRMSCGQDCCPLS